MLSCPQSQVALTLLLLVLPEGTRVEWPCAQGCPGLRASAALRRHMVQGRRACLATVGQRETALLHLLGLTVSGLPGFRSRGVLTAVLSALHQPLQKSWASLEGTQPSCKGQGNAERLAGLSPLGMQA